MEKNEYNSKGMADFIVYETLTDLGKTIKVIRDSKSGTDHLLVVPRVDLWKSYTEGKKQKQNERRMKEKLWILYEVLVDRLSA